MPGVRLGVEERETIALGLAREEPFAQIARRLGRPTSTIAQEVNRSGGRGAYSGRAAQRRSDQAAKRPKTLKLVERPALAAVVAAGLAQRWSPGEIGARLVLDYPEDQEMRVRLIVNRAYGFHSAKAALGSSC